MSGEVAKVQRENRALKSRIEKLQEACTHTLVRLQHMPCPTERQEADRASALENELDDAKRAKDRFQQERLNYIAQTAPRTASSTNP